MASSWGPQTFRALVRLGIPVYLDEGEQVGIGEQPFWFGGMLNIFNMGRYQIRSSLNDESALPEAIERFDHAAEQCVISVSLRRVLAGPHPSGK